MKVSVLCKDIGISRGFVEQLNNLSLDGYIFSSESFDNNNIENYDLILLDLSSAPLEYEDYNKTLEKLKSKNVFIGALIAQDQRQDLWDFLNFHSFDISIYIPINKFQVKQQFTLINRINSYTSHQTVLSHDRTNDNEEWLYLTQSYAKYSGKEFFEEITKYIATNMGLDSVFVGEYQGDSKSVRVIGGYENGDKMGDLNYMVEDTPCAQVMGKKICVYEKGVQHKFPKDHLLKEFNIEGYVGSPLLDKKNNSIGVLVGTKCSPINNGHFILNYLRFFVDIISAEIVRSRVEKDYNKSLLELKQAQTVAKVGSWYWDLESNKLVWSDEMYRLYGLKKPCQDKIQAVSNLVFDEDKDILDKALASIYTDKVPENIVYRILRNNKELVYVQANLDKVIDSEGNIIQLVGTAQDITEQKKLEGYLLKAKQRSEESEQKLMIQNEEYASLNEEHLVTIEELKNTTNRLVEEQELFKQLFNEHSAIKIIIDPKTKYIFNVNKAAIDFYGWSLTELTKMKVSDINILPNHKIDELIGNIKVGYETRFETKHKTAKGKIVDVQVFSNLIPIAGKNYIYSIIHDISEQKKYQSKAKLYQRAIEQSPITIVITDRSGVIEYINPSFTKVTGYSQIEVIGKKPSILKSGMHSKELYKELWDTILSGKAWHGELINKRKSGENYWISKAISPIFNENKEIFQFISVSEDITEKKRILEELIESKDKAEESDRLKTAFLANMSHEVRTPMNGILGFLSLMNEDDISEQEKKQYIEIVQKSSQRLLSTINDIIEISIIEAGDIPIVKESFNLNNIFNELLLFFSPQTTEKGVKLYVNIPDEHYHLYTDKNKLESNLINLIKNAIKFTHSGYIEFGYKEEDSHIVFYVKDSGMGISKEKQASVFERFVQADLSSTRNDQGSGLGLSITKAYTEKLGGKIWMESEIDKGSTFYFSISN